MKEFHIYFGLKDADLIYWKQSVPDNCFGNYVRAILVAEKRKKIAYVPVPSQRGRAYGKSESKIHLVDKEAAALLESIPSYKRNTELKRILRKHLEANYNGYFSKKPVSVTEVAEEHEEQIENIPTEEIIPEQDTINESVAVIEESDDTVTETDEPDDDEMSDEYRKMLEQMSGN